MKHFLKRLGTLKVAFEASGHNVKKLLLDLTQTDAFLYLGEGDSL